MGGRLGFVETERGRWRVARSVLLDVSTRAAGIAGGIGENQRPPRAPVTLAPEDKAFVDSEGGKGWALRCYQHMRAGAPPMRVPPATRRWR